MHSKNRASEVATKNVATLHSEWNVERSKEYFLRNIKNFHILNYLYVLDKDKKLVGVISKAELFSEPGSKNILEVSNTSVVSIHKTAHPIKASYLATKKNISAVPVVDEEKHFLGAIPAEKLLSLLYTKLHLHILKFAGVQGVQELHKLDGRFDNVLTTPLHISLKHRLPWLVIGIVGGFFSAQIIGLFEATLEKNILLAAFIPLIVYVSDAVGTQMEAFIIRDLAFEQKFSFVSYFIRQLFITVVIGSICGLLLTLGTFLYYQDPALAVVLGLSLFIAVCSAIFTGLLIPLFLYRFRIDPATASGPIATIVQDILSVVIYFSIATRIL